VRSLAWLGFVALTVAADVAAPVPATAQQEIAPPFAVRSLEGKMVRLTDFRGRPLVLDFWATWCGPCRAGMPHLNEIHSRYADRGLVVLGLSVDEGSPASVRRFADRLGVKFPLAMANDQILDLYGPIRSIPTTFFINRRGEVVRRVRGYLDPETLEGYVRELF
jgi:cytochrome c biogenesis protein CcmG/thiol:disulfide interchange protein DsbE